MILDKQPPTPANYRAALARLFGDQADALLRLYPGATPKQVKLSASALAGDLFIAHSTWRWMDLQRRHSQAPVYYYLYAHPRPAKRHPAPGEQPDAGAVHSGEIEYALGNLDSNPVYAWTATDHAVSRIMEGYFAHFIRTGNPNGTGMPSWPPVGSGTDGLPRQTIDAHIRTEPDRETARQTFLQRYLATHSNPLGD